MGIKKIITIGKALLSDAPVEETWYQERIAICSPCEENSDNIPKEEWDLPTRIKNEIRPDEPICIACGCWINAKAGVKSEVCGKIKKNERPKWPALQLESRMEKGLVIDNLTPDKGKIVQEGGIFTINLNKIEDTVAVFDFQLKHSSGFNYETSRAGCMCTVSTVKQIDSKTCQFFVKINTKEFGEGITERTLEIKYSHSGKSQKTVNIKFRYIK